jgi:hypothetical protein
MSHLHLQRLSAEGGGGKGESHKDPSLKYEQPVQKPDIRLSWTAVSPYIKIIANSFNNLPASLADTSAKLEQAINVTEHAIENKEELNLVKSEQELRTSVECLLRQLASLR